MGNFRRYNMLRNLDSSSMLKEENFDRLIFFRYMVVELKMPWVDVAKRIQLPVTLHKFIINVMN